MTLMDLKCVNACTGNRNTKKCNLCQQQQSQYKKHGNVFPTVTDNLKYGLNLLHCHIRTLEFLMVVAYKSPFKTWIIRDKEALRAQETLVQQRVWDEFNVLVDQVLQGKGKTNTGGIAKKCLAEPKKFADALGLDVELITRISTILSAFSTHNPVDYDKLEEYCLETNEMFYRLYPWAEMRPTVHKLLVHGCEIARCFPYPQLYYAEDALEHWHQLLRKFYRTHARQSSRLHRITDLMNYSVYLTDPHISLTYVDYRIKTFKHTYRHQDISRFLIHQSDSSNTATVAQQQNQSQQADDDSDDEEEQETRYLNDNSDDDMDIDLS